METPIPQFYAVFSALILYGRTSSGSYPYDIICNNQTQFACICYHKDGSLRSYFPDCYAMIASRNLTVTAITAEKLDITDHRDGQQTEQIFKQELAEIISQPCESLANTCKGTALAIHPESVVILRVACEPQDETIITLAVTNSRKVNLLRPENTLDANIAVDALKDNPRKLLKLETRLYPAKILEVSNDTIILIPGEYTGDQWRDNFSMIVVLLTLAGLLVLIYIIAIIKVAR